MRVPLAPTIVLVVLACTGEDAERATAVRRDSAGISIIESRASLWREGEAWVVSSEPILEIGAGVRDERHQLFRVQDVTVSPAGHIVVVNGGTSDVRVYSENGDHLRTIGREGQGPGEFRFPRHAWLLPGDTLIVGDFDRASLFDPIGRFVRTESYGILSPVDRLEDGTFVGTVFAPGQDPFVLGYSRPNLAIVAGAAGAQTDTLAEMTGGEVYRISHDGRGISSYLAPFGAERLLAVSGNSIYTGDGARSEIYEMDHFGDLRRIIRWNAPFKEVTAESRAAFEEARVAGAQTDRDRQRWQQLFREWRYPTVQPVYDELLVDRLGNIWTRQYQLDNEMTSSWTIFSASGQWLGEVVLPGRYVVHEVGLDYVVGVWTDELGVEIIQVYELRRP